MRGRTIRVALSLVLIGAATAATTGPDPQRAEREAATALRRAQLEQELIMAEGTATMYGDLERALLEMRDAGETR